MKQKLKAKFSGRETKSNKKSATKCSKMSEKGVENLKVYNGILNGETQSHRTANNNNSTNQKQSKLGNSNDNLSGSKIVGGGRLQFYKDGKFILELARAREGEKTGWISVPRKTFWPPTISTNSSTTFSKHESSTSLSYSDDNSSIQSSPWQRDHCWKQSQPRQNISKELSLYYYRPQVLHLSKECVKVAQQKRRRPLDKNGNLKFNKLPDKQESSDNEKEDKQEIKKEEAQICEEKLKNGSGDEKTDSEKNGTDEDVEKDVKCKDDIDVKPIIANGLKTPDKKQESKDQVDSHNGDTKKKPESHNKLDGILKKLCEKMARKLTTTNGNTNTSHATTTTVIPSTYSLASHIATNIQQHHQHVSPRKRILRELEKVSLEDTKRSRPKHSATINNINNNNNLNNINNNNHSNFVSTVTPAVNIVNGTSNGTANNKPSAVTRPFSSYSITSLLGHNSNNNNNNNNNNNTGCNSINDNNNESSSSSTSHYNQHQPHQQQQHFKESDSAPQRISLSPQSPPPPTPLQQHHHSAKMQQNKRKSPIYTTNITPPMGANNSEYVTTTPPSRSYGVRSPDLSPSPEHHAFQKYRPTTTPSTTNSSSPYSYHSPNYMRGSPSPHERGGAVVTGGESYNNRLRTTGNYMQPMSPQHRTFVANNHSPSHYSRQSSPNYGTSAGNHHHRDSSLSPNVTENRTTPTNNSNNINNNGVSGGSGVGGGSSASSSIRTVPKKTPALRQQFSSPTMDHPVKLNKSVSKGPTSMEVDGNALIRPSALIPPSLHPPPPSHPASMYYMYPPISYLPPSVAPYYHSFYNPAMNAYPMRYPMHPGAISGYPPSLSPVSNAPMVTSQGNSPATQSSPNNSQRNAMMLSSSPTASNHPLHHHSPYVPTNPWNPIPLTTHSINDGNLIQNIKDELSSDVPLNLSKH